jgi:hypothetical protein
MINTQPLEQADFSGGITDNYLEAQPNQYQTADNLLITKNKKLMTRPGSEVDYATNPDDKIPAGNQRIGAIINFDNNSKLLVQSAANMYFRNSLTSGGDPTGAYSTLLGPSSNPAFYSSTTANYISWAQWNGHLIVTTDSFASRPMKIFKDNSSIVQLRNAGLPALASSPSVVSSGGVGANNYIYAFVRSVSYQVEGGVTFVDYSAVTYVELNAVDAPNVSTVNITSIPVFSNGTSNNVLTASLYTQIYRTTNNGSVFYYVDQVLNGTTTYNDTANDTSIQTNGALLYTTGGVVENDEPPFCKYVHVVGDICWYAHVKYGSETFKNRIMQSVPVDVDSVPEDFYIDVEEEITGLSSAKGRPIVLCKNYIYRIDGVIDELGRGVLTHQRISDTVGCVSNRSVVRANDIIFWAGNDGFYTSDGYVVQKISSELNTTYKTLVETSAKRDKIFGTYDEVENRIYWCVDDGDSAENNKWFILDLNFGIRPNSSFTTASNAESNFTPTAVSFFNRKIYQADSRGYILKHQSDVLEDPKIDTGTAASNWDTTTIRYNFVSGALNFGSNFLRKWVSRLSVILDNLSTVSLQISSINDDGKVELPLREIRDRTSILWGDPDVYWGDPSIIWNKSGVVERQLRFPAGGLRCTYKQIRMTNSYTVVVNSDILGTGTVNSATSTIVLDTVGAEWPSNSIDYCVSFEADGYDEQYLVTNVSTNTITFEDTSATAPNGVQKWKLSGYKKGEIFGLISYVIHYALMGKTQRFFQGTTAETGDNA